MEIDKREKGVYRRERNRDIAIKKICFSGGPTNRNTVIFGTNLIILKELG